MKESHIQLAEHYFNDLAKHFPVMCASDEFHFFPRAKAASMYYGVLDNFDADVIKEFILKMEEYKRQFSLLSNRESNLDNLIDLELLKTSIAGILIELEKKRAWCHNPLLYLKIAFIGVEHALTKPAAEPKERIERVCARLSFIPRLFNEAIENIESIPETYYKASLAMLTDCRRFLAETGKDLSHEGGGNLTKMLDNAISSLNTFNKFLRSISPIVDQQLAPASLEVTLKDHFLCAKDLSEIFNMAVDEWFEDLKQLEKLRSKIDATRSWQELYHSFCPSDIMEMDTFSLYQREMEEARSFFSKHGFKEGDLFSPVKFHETPTYLRSVRGAASFCAAFSKDVREKSLFYITTRLPRQSSKESGELLKKRLHREYKFLTAHETIPGHHLLDSIRRRLKNPVRSQIESPLFYEGWASYAETLLAEHGYVSNPIEYLVDYRRRLWRSARCQIDVGLPTGKLDLGGAIRLLETVGFSKEEAIQQINRFQLNPGYQLCYSLGRYDIMKLKEKFAPELGPENFHAYLLEGGELPFHLIEKRFEALSSRDVKRR